VRSLTPLEQPRIPTAFAGRAPSGMLSAARAGIQASFAVVGYKGRTWTIKHRGESHIVKDDRGKPASEIEVVIVGVASGVSKTYYQKNYSEGDDFAPDCFSLDGVTPDVNAPHKQNPVCQTCEQNQWGSAVTDTGRRAKACKDTRRIAVVPLSNIANASLGGPMLLRIPPTSLPNLAGYSDFLELKGADFPYVGTTLGFDYDVAYPKITFKALGFLDDEQAAEVVEVMGDPLINRMLNEAGPTAQAPAAEAVGELTGRPAAAFQKPADQETLQLKAQKVVPLKPETRTVVGQDAPAPRGRPRKQQQAPPETAPADLGSMIDDLIGGDDAA